MKQFQMHVEKCLSIRFHCECVCDLNIWLDETLVDRNICGQIMNSSFGLLMKLSLSVTTCFKYPQMKCVDDLISNWNIQSIALDNIVWNLLQAWNRWHCFFFHLFHFNTKLTILENINIELFALVSTVKKRRRGAQGAVNNQLCHT